MPTDGGDDYAVGYRKPPRHSQFKKGQSGNPRGRTKGRKNLATLIMSALNEPVNITQNGRRKTITKLEAMTKQLANKGAAGDPKATQLLTDLIQMFETRPEPSGPKGAVADSDQQVMEQLFARIGRMGNGNDEDTAPA